MGSIAAHGISSDIAEVSASILTSSVTDSVGSPIGVMHAGVALDVDLAARELGAAELIPGDRQLAHDRVEHAPGEHPVDLRQMALLGRVGGLAAEQAFERLQHERQLDAHQHVPFDRLGLDGHGDRVGGQLRLGGGPGVLADVGEDELDLGFQLGCEPAAERLAEHVERAHDAPAQLGGELGWLGEVERADALGPTLVCSTPVGSTAPGARFSASGSRRARGRGRRCAPGPRSCPRSALLGRRLHPRRELTRPRRRATPPVAAARLAGGSALAGWSAAPAPSASWAPSIAGALRRTGRRGSR